MFRLVHRCLSAELGSNQTSESFSDPMNSLIPRRQWSSLLIFESLGMIPPKGWSRQRLDDKTRGTTDSYGATITEEALK